MTKKGTIVIEAHIKNKDIAKELLDDLEALSDKYDVTIDLKIYPSLQECYTPI